MALPYWAAIVYFLGPFLLSLHLVCHRKLFRQEYSWGNRLWSWPLGPFFGQIPEGFYAHHISMHHRENNLADDLSSTLKYQRDSFLGWLKYFALFVSCGRLTLLGYLYKKDRKQVFWRLMAGMTFFYGSILAALLINPRAAVVVFVVPTLIAWFGLMAGNWTQHAFIDRTDPANPYKNSITVINSVYNRRCFNDGYHIGHHVSQARHWTEMPADFLANRQQYIEHDAIVFRTLDYQIIWFLLMFKRYKTLARFFVDLRPGTPRSEEQIIALLKSRTVHH